MHRVPDSSLATPMDNSVPPDILFSKHRILPLPNGIERVPQEAAYRFQCWCDFLGVSIRSLIEPWIPIGNIGPVLLLAHYDPFATEMVLPRWFCGRFNISRENYLALQRDLNDMEEDPISLQYERPAKNWPGSAPDFNEDFEASQFILDHVIMDDSLRIAATSAVRYRALAAEMPPELRETVLLLRHQCAITEMRFIRPPQALTELAPNTFGRYSSVAFYRTDRAVWLATPLAPDDPARRECIDNFIAEARIKPQPRVQIVVAPRDQIANLLLRSKSGAMESTAVKVVGHYARKADLTLDLVQLQQIDPHKNDTSERKIVEWLIGHTILNNSQDLHADYANGEGRFRINIDGKLQEILRVTESRWRICNALFRDHARCTKSEFDCESKHFTCRLDSELVDFRVEATTFRDGSMPPSLTLRLLGRQSTGRLLSDLRLREDDVSGIRDFIRLPYGLILVTGPTGSGKTTTLYAALNELNKPDVKILTAEDPIEQIIDGVLQSQVDEGKGITYEKLLRSFLRNAPNVILIGEIRDKETAKIAVEAAGTGHLVLATLHTNTIAGAVTRLHDAFGINRSVLSDVFIGGLSQRLLRMLCPECKQGTLLSAEETALFKRLDIPTPSRCYRRRAGGCHHCSGRGIFGRVAVMELMRNNRKLRAGIRDNKNAEELSDLSHANGHSSILREGLARFAEGVVDFEDIRLFEILDR
jgi:type II secretory ATPase GspE/PulE/Tfp pilus assembly ATPase PilB-like protein